MSESSSVLARLLTTRSLSDSKECVANLVSDCEFQWRPVGDRENNYGQINIGSDPGHALVERVTNALDAVLEFEAAKRERAGSLGEFPGEPRAAVEQWFDVRAGRIRYLDISKRQALADNVTVKLLSGSSRRSPTIEVRDRGIGLEAAQFPHTILGLGGSNKIDKPYLAGAYGQGGSTALAFSPDGALIASRRQPELLNGRRDEVAVTFARFRDLDPAVNKNGRYEFLVNQEGLVPTISPEQAGDFEPGTSVVHYDMGIPKYAARLTQLTGSLWWLLQNTLFDPVLPIWAEEHRSEIIKSGSPDRRTIAGNHARLWEDARDRIEHADSIVISLDEKSGGNEVTVHYWVVKEREGDSKAARPIDAYVDPFHPVAYTYFGQTHGLEDQRFISERLLLSYLKKFLIIHVELDRISPAVRRSLLSTTRDRLKQSTVYDEIRERIAAALAEDENLIRLDDERREAILSRHSEDERKRMRERFARLMQQFQAGTDATASGKGDKSGGRTEKRGKTREPLEPLPTRDQPTFIRIANVQRPIPIRRDRRALVRLESDAPDGYITRQGESVLILDPEPEDVIIQESVSDFRGGRSRMLVKPHPDVKANVRGVIRVTLETPEGERFTSSAPFEIVEPQEKSTSGDTGRAQVKAPEPIPINEDEWDMFGWDETSVAEVRETKEGSQIYVNIDNRHIRHLLTAGGYQERGIKRMRGNYLLYIAFFAWLQHDRTKDGVPGLEGSTFEEYVQDELDRAAQTVVHSIAGEGRLDT